jgi:hypothetical protein
VTSRAGRAPPAAPPHHGAARRAARGNSRELPDGPPAKGQRAVCPAAAGRVPGCSGPCARLQRAVCQAAAGRVPGCSGPCARLQRAVCQAAAGRVPSCSGPFTRLQLPPPSRPVEPQAVARRSHPWPRPWRPFVAPGRPWAESPPPGEGSHGCGKSLPGRSHKPLSGAPSGLRYAWLTMLGLSKGAPPGGAPLPGPRAGAGATTTLDAGSSPWLRVLEAGWFLGSSSPA